MRRKTIPIAFRADEDMLRLIDQARAPFGISRGDWARGVLTTRLMEKDDDPRAAQLADVADAVRRIEDDLASLKTNLARTLLIVLTAIGNVEPETAQEIVRSKLLR